MLAAIEQFRANLERTRNLGALYAAMGAHTTQALDLSDLLRAELASAVSSFDHFVHEAVRLGMLEIQIGSRAPTPSFQLFLVTVESVREALANPQSTAWLDAQIRDRHAWRSFQHSDNVAEALRLVLDVRLWDEVARRMGMPAQDVKRQLNLIVERRNKIAHEADVDPSFPGLRWPIDKPMVDGAVDFLELLAETIHTIL